MKKTYIINILLITIMILYTYIPVSDANTSWDEILSQGDKFLKSGKQENQDSPVNNIKLNKTIKSLYNILLAAGIVLSVIVGSILGIKLMTSGIEEKAKIKEMIVPYVFGCIVVFGAFGIWKLVIRIMSNIEV